jgi:ribosome maturation factor RimP
MQQLTQSSKAGLDLERIRTVLAPTMAAHGVSLVDIEWLTERAGWTLRLTIEREGTGIEGSDDQNTRNKQNTQGGVTIEDCAEVSRDASAVLDVDDFIPQHYNLEVSSPGLDRRLRSPAEFSRFLGKTVKVKLSRPAVDGQMLLRGPLDAAIDGRVAVIVDGKRLEVPIDDVEDARLVFELDSQPKPKPKPKAKTGARQDKGKSGTGQPRGPKAKLEGR